MFEVGKYVVYGMTGVCKICEISPLNFGQEGIYYTLHRVQDMQNDLIYAPVASVESGKVMLRDMISREEAETLLSEPSTEPLEWIPDLRKRNERYTQLLASGESSNWKRLIICLHQKQKEKQREQRTLPRRDQELLHLAENLFFDELSAVLHQTEEEVKQQFMGLLDPAEVQEKGLLASR